MGANWSRSCNECFKTTGRECADCTQICNDSCTACTKASCECLNNVGKACSKCCNRSDPLAHDRLLDYYNDSTLLIIDQNVPKSILDEIHESLWHSVHAVNTPLFRLDPIKFWSCIGVWIKNDVRYKKVLNEMKRVCRQSHISGSVLSFFYIEKKEDPALIEDAVRKEMKRYLTKKTMDIILDGLKEWIRTVDANQLRGVTTDEIAEFLMEIPIGNLKEEITNKDINGRWFIENAVEFEDIVQRVTEWTKSECDLLRKTMERRISLTTDQFMDRMESQAKEKEFAPTVIAKMKNRLESENNLEDVHYELRTKGMVRRDFSVSVLSLLSDLMAEQKENQIDDEDQFVVDYFDVLSSVSLMITVDNDGNEVIGPYICPCCGNLNVVKIVEYQYTDISVCSLCGVSAKEAVTMALKRGPLPYQGTMEDDILNDTDEITLYYPMSIHSEPLQWARNKRMDLHCAAQRDSNLCPILQRVALMLMEQTRFRLLIGGQRKDTKLSEEDLNQFLTLKEYKETLLGVAEDKLIKKEPDIKDDAMQKLRNLIGDDAHSLCDFGRYFMVKGARKEFLKILKKVTKMKPGTASAIFKSILVQLQKVVITEQYRLWLQKLDIEDIKSDRKHIDKYHLRNASAPKKEAILSIFRTAIGEEEDDQTPGIPNDAVEEELDRFRLQLVNGDDSKDDRDDGGDRDEQKSTEMQLAPPHAESKEINPWKFITETEDINEFAFGVEMNYISRSLRPRVNSLREELHSIGFGNVFFNILAKAIREYLAIRKKNDIFEVSREYVEQHGILRNQYISMIHFVAILLYTDCSEFSHFTP